MNYILASKSPRRKEILENLGVAFEVVTADVDESSDVTDPCRLVEILSERKGLAVRDLLLRQGRDLSDTVIISSDTVVAVGGEILGIAGISGSGQKELLEAIARIDKLIKSLIQQENKRDGDYQN